MKKSLLGFVCIATLLGMAYNAHALEKAVLGILANVPAAGKFDPELLKQACYVQALLEKEVGKDNAKPTSAALVNAFKGKEAAKDMKIATGIAIPGNTAMVATTHLAPILNYYRAEVAKSAGGGAGDGKYQAYVTEQIAKKRSVQELLAELFDADLKRLDDEKLKNSKAGAEVLEKLPGGQALAKDIVVKVKALK